MARVALMALVLACSCRHTPSPSSEGPSRSAASTPPQTADRPGTMTATTAVGSIGTARMEADGTLVLLLRATTGGGTGEGRFVYPPSHPQYRKILDHVGPIKPGEEKSVAPFPDE